MKNTEKEIIEKEGLVFIEPAKRALGTKSEIAEIQGFLKRSMK